LLPKIYLQSHFKNTKWQQKNILFPIVAPLLDQPSFPPRDTIFSLLDRFFAPLGFELELLGSRNPPLTTTPHNHLWLKEGCSPFTLTFLNLFEFL
jgi:hypothetical protein